MARSLLLAATAAWVAAGAGGLLIGAVGASTLQRLLPPLAIDLDALRGAITAVAAGILAVGALHGAVVFALRRGGRRAASAALLLAAFVAVLLLALAAAAATAAAATPSNAPGLVAAGLAALGGAGGYGLVGSLLLREVRSGSAT